MTTVSATPHYANTERRKGVYAYTRQKKRTHPNWVDHTLSGVLAIVGTVTPVVVGNSLAQAYKYYQNTSPTAIRAIESAPTPIVQLPPVQMSAQILPKITAPVVVATPAIAAPAIAPATVESTHLFLDLRPDFQLPALNKPYQRAAMQYTGKNEGFENGSYQDPKNKTTIGIGCYIASNLGLFMQTMNCPTDIAEKVASGEVSVKLSDQAVVGLYSAYFNNAEAVLKQKCKNRGMNFDALPDRAKIALIDISYVRPGWVDDKLLASVKAGNYGIAAFQIGKISNSYVASRTERGLARRMAMNSLLLHEATPNHATRGKHPQTKYDLSSADIAYVRSLAAAQANQAYAPPQKQQSR